MASNVSIAAYVELTLRHVNIGLQLCRLRNYSSCATVVLSTVQRQWLRHSETAACCVVCCECGGTIVDAVVLLF